MNRVSPTVKMVLAVVMAVLSYLVAVDNFVDGDIETGVVLAIIGVFFTRHAVLHFLRNKREKAEHLTAR